MEYLMDRVQASRAGTGRTVKISLPFLLLLCCQSAFAQSSPIGEIPASLLQDVNGTGMIETTAFGDSITRGVGDFTDPNDERSTQELTFPSGEAGYPLRLERLLGIPVTNAGIPGEVLSTAGLRRFARTIPNNRPDLVIVSGGTNDIARRIPAGDFARSVQTIINIAFAVGTVPVLATIPPTCCDHSGFQPFVDSFNQQLRSLAAINEIRLADINHAYTNTCVDSNCHLLNRPEGEHPNSAGYDVSGEAVSATILGINLFALDGPTLLEQALGLPPGTVKTKPDPAPPAPAPM